MAKKQSKPVRKAPAKASRRTVRKARPKAKPAAKSSAVSAKRGKHKPARSTPVASKLAKGKLAPKTGARKPKKPVAKPTSRVAAKGKPVARKPVAKANPKLAPKPAHAAKVAPKPTGKPQAPAKAGAQAAPAVKPSAGEIAARLSARRTEKALAEGKARGKNGSLELRKVELTPAEAEARKTRLKNLIVLGKERSYLTYAEINDHLPDDILDAEQIEGIISMINDMGIQVYDEAPDAETLLMSEAAPTAAADDVDEEAAEAAASTLDSEFGRTTDPVRMYMREMGSVELLTREGEIEIAKRIEEGLKYMIMAISACPMTVAQILELATKIERDELKIDDVVDGLMDFNEQLEAIEDDELEEAEESEDDSGAIAAENLERLKVAGSSASR